MKNVSIVIGLGFGDEGKGLTTDYLAFQKENSIVIRFNGGHQAGHSVNTSGGKAHIFSSLGSGTLRNVPTFWSRFCTFSPDRFLQELSELDFQTNFYIDWESPITTHYDILFNRCLESSLLHRKGSCGLGFGATQSRSKIKELSLTFNDLYDARQVGKILKKIRAYYRGKVNLETDFDFDSFDNNVFDIQFLDTCEMIRELVSQKVIIPTSEESIISNEAQWTNYIFEGAQGILLDQNYGTRPHITKSNTTSRNALKILNRQNLQCNIDIFLVTRCYHTRHGAGPFRDSDESFHLVNTSTETNIENPFQGVFRRNYLDLDLINYALKCESEQSGEIAKNLVITCLDQLPSEEIFYYYENSLKSIHYKEIHTKMKSTFKEVRYSFSNCGEYLQ